MTAIEAASSLFPYVPDIDMQPSPIADTLSAPCPNSRCSNGKAPLCSFGLDDSSLPALGEGDQGRWRRESADEGERRPLSRDGRALRRCAAPASNDGGPARKPGE